MTTRDVLYDGMNKILQVLWIFIFWWAIPFGIFYALFPGNEGYTMLFDNTELGVTLSFGALIIGVFAMIGGILINWGDAVYDTPKQRFWYAVFLPLYPFYTCVYGVCWNRKHGFRF